MMRLVTLGVLLSALACEPTGDSTSEPGGRATVPEPAGPPDASSEAAFTKWCHAYVSSKASATRFEIAAEGPLTLTAWNSAGERLTIALDKPWEVCAKRATGCDAETRRWLSALVSTIDEPQPGPDRERVRAAVRSDATVTGMKRSGAQLITEPLVPGLNVVYMIDLPTAARAMKAEDLEALGIDVAELHALASANLLREVGSPEQLVKTPVRGIGQIEVSNYYTSSMVLQHDAWKSASDALDGQLIVAIPVPELLLYADGRDREAVVQLLATVQEITSVAPNPVFDGVLRWTPGGWEVLATR